MWCLISIVFVTVCMFFVFVTKCFKYMHIWCKFVWVLSIRVRFALHHLPPQLATSDEPALADFMAMFLRPSRRPSLAPQAQATLVWSLCDTMHTYYSIIIFQHSYHHLAFCSYRILLRPAILRLIWWFRVIMPAMTPPLCHVHCCWPLRGVERREKWRVAAVEGNQVLLCCRCEWGIQ